MVSGSFFQQSLEPSGRRSARGSDDAEPQESTICFLDAGLDSFQPKSELFGEPIESAPSHRCDLVASEQGRSKVGRFRERWKALQHRISADRLVFLDETWNRTDMTRLRGWFPRGSALVAKVPQGHWKTLTLIGALRQDEIVAPCVFDGHQRNR